MLVKEYKIIDGELCLDIRGASNKLISRSFHEDQTDAENYAEDFCKKYLAGEPTPFHK